MSEDNGQTPVETPAFMPGLNGGKLRRGGPNPKRNGGRPPNVIRAGFRQSLVVEERKLRAHVHEIESHIRALEPLRDGEQEPEVRLAKRLNDLERLLRARSQLTDFLAKYGLGTTVTETDTEGKDVPRPQVIGYMPINGRDFNR